MARIAKSRSILLPAGLTGPPGTWRVTSSGGRGYVADEIAWQKPPGRYQALVTLSEQSSTTTTTIGGSSFNEPGNTAAVLGGIGPFFGSAEFVREERRRARLAP